MARWGDSNGLAGAASLPTLVEPLGRSIVTAVRAATSSLKLITWDLTIRSTVVLTRQ